MLAVFEVSFDLSVLGGLGVAVAGAITSIRLLRPNRERIIAEAESLKGADADRVIAWYKAIVERQDRQLHEAEVEIHALEEEVTRLKRKCDEQDSRYDLLVRKLQRRGIDLSGNGENGLIG